MAVAKVFAVTELLETILLQISARDILAVNTVAKTWNRLIKTSIAINRITFHAPKGRVVQRIRVHCPEYLASVMSLRDIPTLQGKHFEIMPLFDAWDRSDGPRQSKPWIYDIKPTYLADRQLHSLLWGYNASLEYNLSPALRSMFITQPPITTILLFVQHRIFGSLSPCVTLRISGGITLGAVLDTFDRLLHPVQREEIQVTCKTDPPLFGGVFLTSVDPFTPATNVEPLSGRD